MGALDSSQPSKSTWTPNYADVASSVVTGKSDGFVDYLDVMSSPDYTRFVLAAKVNALADSTSQPASGAAANNDTTVSPAPSTDRVANTQPTTDWNGAAIQSQVGAPTPGQYSYERAAQAPQTQATTAGQGGGQWRANYGSDVNNNFRVGQQSQDGQQYRANYGQDVGNNFRVGQASQSGQQYRANYGQDVDNNFQVGQATQGNQQYRANYGQDVGNNFQPGQSDASNQQRTGNQTDIASAQTGSPMQTGGGGGQWRAGYGSDTGTTFQPGQQSQPNGQYRAGYGSDTGTTFRPGVQSGSGNGNDGSYNPNANGQPYNPNANGQPYNPNANGNATITAPRFHPNTANMPQQQFPSMETAARQGTPGAQPKSAAAATSDTLPGGPRGGNFWNHQNSTIQAVDHQLLPNSVSVLGMYGIGGVGGVLGGQVLTPLLDRMANSVLINRDVNAPPGGTLSGLAQKLPRGVQERIKPTVNSVEAGMENVGQRLKGQEGGLRYRMAKAWKDNFDPKTKVAADLKLQADHAKDKLGELDLQLKQARGRYDEFHAGLAEKGIDLSKTSDSEILDQAKNLGSEVQGLEASLMAERQSLASKTETGILNKDILREKSAGIMKNFAQGALAAGIGMSVDDALDRLSGNHDHKFGISATTAATVPFALSLGKNWGQKALYSAGFAAAGFAANKAMDAILPKQTVQSFGQTFRPNGVDAITMGIAAALPANNVRTNLALTTTGWAVGRMCNSDFWSSVGWAGAGGIAGYLLGPNAEMKTAAVALDGAGWLFSRWEHSRYPGTKSADLNDTAWSSVKEDSAKRTEGSMDDAISQMTALGESSQGALQFYFNDWCRKNRSFPDQVTAYRGATILTASLGESRLKLGTVIAQDAHSNPTAYLPGMAGMDLDLGGQALRSLLLSENCVNMAIKETQKNMGQKIDGREVTQSEVDDLNKIKDQVTDTINNKVYGKHDIDKAYDYFTGWYHDNLQTGGHLIEKTQQSIQSNLNQQNFNPQFVAKLCRDEALMKMAVAQFNINHDAGSAQSMIYGNPVANGQRVAPDGVAGLLQLAGQLDPNNADMPALNNLLSQFESKLPGAVQSQVSNPHYNPNNVGNALPPVKR